MPDEEGDEVLGFNNRNSAKAAEAAAKKAKE